MVAEGDQAHKPIGRHVTLENAGRALPVLALMLPATGAVYRMTAFAISALPVPQRLAVALPVTDLGFIGFGVIAPSLLVGLFLAFFMVGFRRLTRLPDLLDEQGRFALLFGVVVGATFLSLVLASFISRGASEILRGVASVVVVVWLTWVLLTSPRRLPLSRLVGPIILFSAMTALLNGVSPTPAGTLIASIHFDPATGLRDGTFTLLGEDDSTTWLLSCEPGASPIRVRSDGMVAVASVQFGPIPEPPSLGQMVATGSIQPAGFVQMCP